MMQFLFSHPIPDRPKVLLVQTANPNLIRHVLADLMRRFQGAEITLFRQRNMEPHLQPPPGVQVIDNVDRGKLARARAMRKEGYDVVCMVRSGESDFWKLKLLPFFCNPKKIILYDRFATPRDFNGRLLVPHWASFQSTGELNLVRRALAPFLFAYVGMEYWIAGRGGGKEKISRR